MAPTSEKPLISAVVDLEIHPVHAQQHPPPVSEECGSSRAFWPFSSEKEPLISSVGARYFF